MNLKNVRVWVFALCFLAIFGFITPSALAAQELGFGVRVVPRQKMVAIYNQAGFFSDQGKIQIESNAPWTLIVEVLEDCGYRVNVTTVSNLRNSRQVAYLQPAFYGGPSGQQEIGWDVQMETDKSNVQFIVTISSP